MKNKNNKPIFSLEMWDGDNILVLVFSDKCKMIGPLLFGDTTSKSLKKLKGTNVVQISVTDEVIVSPEIIGGFRRIGEMELNNPNDDIAEELARIVHQPQEFYEFLQHKFIDNKPVLH